MSLVIKGFYAQKYNFILNVINNYSCVIKWLQYKNKHYCTDDGCPDFYKEEPELTAMEKFFDCLGDSSKCEDLKNNDN